MLTCHKSLSQLPDDEIFDTFYQTEDAPDCSGKAFVYAFDQYGRIWDDTSFSVTNVSHPDTDSGSRGGGDTLDGGLSGRYVDLRSNLGTDHKSVYEFTYGTGNSVHPKVSRTFDADFIFRSRLGVVLGEETVFSKSDFSGRFINIPEDTPGLSVPEGYKMTGFALTGAGVIAEDGEGGWQYTFGTAPGTVTAKLAAVKYSIAFDGNGSDSGRITNIRNLAYGTMKKLPSCTFTKEGYDFTDWNTEPDGSGDSFANVSFVSNLTAEDGATVTLYAQWERSAHKVTLIYPDEIGMDDEMLSVGHGGSVAVNEIIRGGSEDGHYEFVSADRSLDNITADTEIHLDYAKKAHTFGADNITREASCSSSGEIENICGRCGFVRTSEIPADAGRHDYSAEKWEWSEDHRSAEVTVTCSRCGDTLTGGTSEGGAVAYTDSGTTRAYTATVPVDAGDLGVLTFENETVCKDFLEQVSYVDENGHTGTVYAIPVTSAAVPDGGKYFVKGQITLTQALRFPNDTDLILCDGASLSIGTSENGSAALRVYKPDPTGNNTGSLTVYGQNEQSGSLSVRGWGGIECCSYYQYGGKVDADVSSCAICAEAPAVCGGSLEIHGGELKAHSSGNAALLSEHSGVVISGGNVSASADWGNYGIVSAEGGIALSCRNMEDSVKASSYNAADITVMDGRVLTDGYYYFFGELTERQISALSGRKLSRYNGTVPSGTDLSAASASATVGSFIGNGSRFVVILGVAAIVAAVAAMFAVRYRRRKGTAVK